MENNKDGKKRSSLSVLLAASAFMVILNYMLSNTVGFVGQENNKETEVVEETEVIEETEQIEEELHRVYSDLDIDDKKHNLSMSTDETYFLYKCYYEVDALDFISKLDNSPNYEMIDIHKDGSYTYIVFKYTVNNDEQTEDTEEETEDLTTV